MPTEPQVLVATAAAVAFVHTIIGPDHYLVFTAMGKAQGWRLAKTLRVTLYCGIGHVLSSVAIGAVGIMIGAQLASLVSIETVRGNIAGWALLVFGLVYFAWGLRNAGRRYRHSHSHRHDGVVHEHEHDHRGAHAHVHTASGRIAITPWALFIVFVLGPCEALIPLFMYPAAQQSASLLITVALVFGVVTLATMVAAVAITTLGIERLRIPFIERYAQAAAGFSVAVCGGVISFIGL